MEVYYRLRHNSLSKAGMVGDSTLFFVNGIYFYNTFIGVVVGPSNNYTVKFQKEIADEYEDLL